MNHLAIFGTDYLELVAVPRGDTGRPEIMEAPLGLNGLVFATQDAAAVFEALRRQEVDIEPPEQFSRPVEVDGGRHDAVFRTTRLPRADVPAGRLYFCEHLTRDLVWRRRVAASCQRRRWHRPGGDRGAGPGHARAAVRPDVRRTDGAGDG